MLVNGYNRLVSRELAGSIVAGADSYTRRVALPAEARVLHLGGQWTPGTWRDHVRDLIKRGTPVAIALRNEPSEQQLTDTQWSQLADDLLRRVGPATRSWALVRTTPTTVTLLTNAPVDVAALRHHARAAAARLHPDAQAEPAVAAPSPGPASPDPARLPPAGITQLSFAAPPTAASPSPATAQPAPVPLSATHQRQTRPAGHPRTR